MTAPYLEDRQLLLELEPVVARQLDRHLSVTKDWMPHEYVPWSLGRDFDGDPYDVSQSRLSSPARVAMEVNLLTEDNLPSYHREIASMFGRDGAWGTWVHRWTAEEGRHAYVMRDYLLVTRGVDPVELENQRMATMQVGYEPLDERTMLRGVAYVSMQELATRISHRNTGKATDDPVADRLLQRIAADENLHMIFYRDLVERRDGADPVADHPGDRRRDHRLPDAGLRHHRLRPQGRGHRQGRHLRPAHPPRRGHLADAAHLEGLRARGPRPRGGEGPRDPRLFMAELDAQATRQEEQRPAPRPEGSPPRR